VLNPITVLMTSVGTDSFPSVLRALKPNSERDIRVIGVDMRATAPGLYMADQGYLVPPRSRPEQLLERLDEICSEEQVQLLYPLSTEDQEFFASEAAQFEAKGIRVIVSPLPAVQMSNDKLRLYEFARSHSIPCPNFMPVHNWDEFQQAVVHLGFPESPCVLKLNKGTGAQGFKVIYPSLDPLQRILDRDNRIVTFQEVACWLQAVEHWPPLHLAEYLPGDEYSVDILCNHGEVLSAVTRLRLSAFYGLALHAQVVLEADVQDVACTLVAKLGLSFVVNVQIRRSDDGTPKLLEINPRIPGTIGLTLASGVNMPYLALKMSLREPFKPPQPRSEMTILRYWEGVCLPTREILS
jgi:carbamoyl-phosphate synthase large subunit